MKKLLSKYDLVHISWHDAAMHGTAQVTFDEAKKYGLMRGHVAGWRVHETEDFITIATDFFPAQANNEKDSFRTLQSYPKSGIEKVVVLDDISKLDLPKRYGVHDYDLTVDLHLLQKLGKLQKVKIIAVPMEMEEKEALERVSEVLLTPKD